MPAYIIHHNGAYNIYTTIADGTYWDEGITLEELCEYLKEEMSHGNLSTFILEGRIQRANEKGCSSYDHDLDDIIRIHNLYNEEMTREQFIEQYLTIRR